MPLININIRNRIAEPAEDAPAYICGNEGYTVVFDFDEEWEEVDIKTMRVTWLDTFTGQQRHIDTEFAGTQLSLPVIADAYDIGIGVYVGDVMASTAAHLPCERSITDGATYHDEPAPDTYAQLLAFLQNNAQGGLIAGPTSVLVEGTEPTACEIGIPSVINS